MEHGFSLKNINQAVNWTKKDLERKGGKQFIRLFHISCLQLKNLNLKATSDMFCFFHSSVLFYIIFFPSVSSINSWWADIPPAHPLSPLWGSAEWGWTERQLPPPVWCRTAPSSPSGCLGWAWACSLAWTSPRLERSLKTARRESPIHGPRLECYSTASEKPGNGES